MSQLEAKWLRLAPAQPWKNGGGVTRPLAELDGEWRVSLANVDANGPYSRFEGMTRLSMVMEGKGVVLRNGETVVALEHQIPTLYDGSLDWTASLIDTPVLALNIMVRTGGYLPSAGILMNRMPLPLGAAAVILSGHSRCLVQLNKTGSTIEIPPRHFLVVDSIDEPMQVARNAETPAGSNPPIVALIEPVGQKSL